MAVLSKGNISRYKEKDEVWQTLIKQLSELRPHYLIDNDLVKYVSHFFIVLDEISHFNLQSAYTREDSSRVLTEAFGKEFSRRAERKAIGEKTGR